MESPNLQGMPATQPKKSNTGLIIAIVVAVLLCCCCIAVLAGVFYIKTKATSAINEQLTAMPDIMTSMPGLMTSIPDLNLFFDKKPASERPWTERLWVYDLRTNKHFTLKQSPLRRSDLDEFVKSYLAGRPRSERSESERWRSFSYEDLIARDKVNLDIRWLRDDSLEDLENLPSPDVIAREIIEDLTAALAEFEAIAEALEVRPGGGSEDL